MVTYISIGNSDDKLSQAQWANFYRSTNLIIREYSMAVHGQWVSEPASAWQNACWCVEVREEHVDKLKYELRFLATSFGQDSIAWAPAVTEFLGVLDETV